MKTTAVYQDDSESVQFFSSDAELFEEMTDFVVLRMIQKNMPKELEIQILVHPNMDSTEGEKAYKRFIASLEHLIPKLTVVDPIKNTQEITELKIKWIGDKKI